MMFCALWPLADNFFVQSLSILHRYIYESMEETRTETSLHRPVSAFSFSIEKILRDDLKHDHSKRSNFKKLPFCSRSHCQDDEKLQPRPFFPYKSPFLACPHPICSAPSNPLVPSDPFRDYHPSRSYFKHSGCSAVPHLVLPGELMKANETLPYNHGLLKFARESDFSSPLRYDGKLSPCNDDRNDSKRKGGQVRFSHVQSVELERVFSLQKYISPQERKQLSRFLQLSERQVKTWFQNRRAKWRRIKMETEMRRRMAHDKVARQIFEIADETKN